jgi:arylsulfatase
MGNLNEHAVINTKNKSHTVTAEVVVPEEPAEGVIISQGGRNGGWSLYAKDGKLKYCYNLLGLRHTYVESNRPIGRSEHQVRMEFKYDGGGMAKGGAVSLYIDGRKTGEGRVDATQPVIYSADETTSVGRETGSGVCPDYPARGNEFKGQVLGVEIDVEDEAEGEEHFIDPERRYATLMARQ